jgi:hypothetical protein
MAGSLEMLLTQPKMREVSMPLPIRGSNPAAVPEGNEAELGLLRRQNFCATYGMSIGR